MKNKLTESPQVYVNWINKVVILKNRVLPFWLHNKYKGKFHEAISKMGFCPLCGETIMVHFSVFEGITLTSIVDVDSKERTLNPGGVLYIPSINAEILQKGGYGEVLNEEWDANEKTPQQSTITGY